MGLNLKDSFDFSKESRPALWLTHPPNQSFPGTLYQGVNRPESEADHLPPSNAAIENVWSYAATPPYIFVAYTYTSMFLPKKYMLKVGAFCDYSILIVFICACL
jgi:hypothetical protein